MTRRRALLYALVVTTLWSTSFVLSKIALGSIGPFWLTFIRYELAAIVLVAVALPDVRRTVREIGLGPLATLGLLGSAFAQAPFLFALARLPASTTLLLGSVGGAIAVAALGALFLGERPTLAGHAGILVTIAGLGLFAGIDPIGALDPAGVIAIAISTIAWASWIVLSRRLMQRAPSAQGLTATSMLVGSLPLLPAAIAAEALPRLDASLVLILAWLAVANTAVAFSLWAASQRALQAYESNLLSNLVLVEASFLAFLILGEALGLAQWTGIALVLGGVALTQLPRRDVTPVLPEEGKA
jgi:drug/metabolite transporter (DMT)-like permease